MSLIALTQATKLCITTNTNTEQLSRIASYFAMTLIGTDSFVLLVIARNEAIALTRAIHLGFEAITLTLAIHLGIEAIALKRAT